LVHPVLDNALVSFTHPSKAAEMMLEKAYDTTARLSAYKFNKDDPGWLSAQCGHTRPALALLGWPTWGDRRRALTEVFAMKVFEDNVPTYLRGLLPPRAALGAETAARLRLRGGLAPIDRPLYALSAKAFTRWGAEAVSAVFTEEPEHSVDSAPEPVGPRPEPRRESDEVATFLGSVRHEYRNEKEHIVAGRVVIWTDGSAASGYAGGGVFYGDGNRRNTAVRVEGRKTAPRAEVTAIAHALLNEDRPMEIRSDCTYAVNGANEGRHLWRRRAWYKTPTMARVIPQANLWHRIDAELERGGKDAKFKYVKGHATYDDVLDGKATARDAWGNGGADLIAQLAARYATTADLPQPHAWQG